MIEVASRFLIANLAAGAAVLLVLLIRKPVRSAFGARLAYTLWLLAPLSALASFLPPRVIEVVVPAFDFGSLPAAEVAPPSAIDVAPPSVSEFGGPVFETAVAAQAPLDPWAIAMFAWIAGAIAMAGWLAFGQSRFLADARRGRAGPAVVGVIRPRIITPSDFDVRFDERERDVILAHETIHLDRNDARTNAFVALTRCICWFNPLIHVAAHVMRIDQELACDAMVVERYPKARGLYASALLKAQLAMRPLPLGCYWPAGGDHPLTERIEMLKQTTPGRMRRVAGVASLAILAAGAGFGAWAAMPPQERFVIAEATTIVATPAIALPAVDPAPEPLMPQQTPAPAPMQPSSPQMPPPQSGIRVDTPGVATFSSRPMKLDANTAIFVRGRVEKLEFGANSYVVFVRAVSLAPARYDGYGRGGPVELNTALWALSSTNYFGNREAIEADLNAKEIEVRGLNVNADCKPDCRIKTQDIYFARSSEVPAPKATDSVLASFANWYDTSMPNLASGKIERVVFHDNNRTFDIYMRSSASVAFPSRLYQVRMEYRHPRADIERALSGTTIVAGGWRAREATNTFCDPCGMFSDSITIQPSTPGEPGARFTPDGAVLTTIMAARPAPVPAPGTSTVIPAQLRIVALKREKLELSSRDMTKFVDRYFEPGEEYLLGGAYAGDWTVSTPDGSAFEWRTGNISLGPIGAGPVRAQNIAALSQRAALAAAQRAAPQPTVPATPQPQSSPPRAAPATSQPIRYEPQQTPSAGKPGADYELITIKSIGVAVTEVKGKVGILYGSETVTLNADVDRVLAQGKVEIRMHGGTYGSEEVTLNADRVIVDFLAPKDSPPGRGNRAIRITADGPQQNQSAFQGSLVVRTDNVRMNAGYQLPHAWPIDNQTPQQGQGDPALHGQLGAALAQRDELARMYSSRHPEVQKAQTRIRELAGRLKLEIIEGVLVEGNSRIPTDTILDRMPLKSGDPLDAARVNLSLQALGATGLFSDVQIVRADPQGKPGVYLRVRVIERSALQPIRYEPQQTPGPDFVPFASLFDADDPIQVKGKVTQVDLSQSYGFVWVQANEATEKGKTGFQPNTRVFRVMLGHKSNTPDWVNLSLVGKDVTVRGYRAKDKTCTDSCLINGRDLVIDGVKQAPSRSAPPALQPTSYQPQQAPASSAAQAGYKLGAGDRVKLVVFNQPDLSGVFLVDGLGAITVPLIGQVEVKGLVVTEVQQRIEAGLKEWLREPRVTAELAESEQPTPAPI